MDERQQQLLAAAEAVRTWVYAQRATWSDDYSHAFADTQPHAAGPEFALALEPGVAFDTMLPAAPSIGLRDRAQTVAEWVRAVASRSAPLVRRSWMAATIATLVIGGAWTVWGYRSGVTAMLTNNLAAGRRAVESGGRTLGDVRSKEQPKPVVPTAGSTATTTQTTGRLEVESSPAGARVLVDGRDRGETPLTLNDLSVGSHKVVIRGAEGSVQRTVAITASQTTQLKEAIFSGWLHVSSPIELQISEGQRAIRLDDSNQVLLAPGSHEVRFENRALGFDETRRVEVKPGDTTSISLEPRPTPLSVTASEAATVSVDGQPVGETPLVDYPVKIGTREVAVTSASGDVRRQTITVTVQPARLEVDFSKP